MRRLADVLSELIHENAFLQLGMGARLFNLSRLAAFLLPTLRARSKRDVQQSAVLMALSRLQRSGSGTFDSATPRWGVDNIVVNSNLCALTYPTSPALRQQAHTLTNRMQREGRFITVTHGIHEMTVIGERQKLQLFRSELSEKPSDVHDRIGSIGVSFRKDYADTPGLFHSIFQQLYLQSINVIEIASTANELVLYLKEDDIQLAFDTLYHQFALRERKGRSEARERSS